MLSVWYRQLLRKELVLPAEAVCPAGGTHSYESLRFNEIRARCARVGLGVNLDDVLPCLNVITGARNVVQLI